MLLGATKVQQQQQSKGSPDEGRRRRMRACFSGVWTLLFIVLFFFFLVILQLQLESRAERVCVFFVILGDPFIVVFLFVAHPHLWASVCGLSPVRFIIMSSPSPVMSEESPAGPIIHIRADSDSTLDDLFDVALKPPGSHHPLQVPLRMRNLPESFFRQPLQTGGIQHSRAHSSPASLQQTLAVAPSPAHARQTSYDPSGDLGPLPPGWEMAKTPQGQLYFMNHISKTTQWEDPRKNIPFNNANTGSSSSNAAVAAPTNAHPSCHSPNPSNTPTTPTPNAANGNVLGPLPPGWDQGETPEGEVYYINHANKKTTWFDPRLPPGSQRKEANRLNRLQRLENERRALQVRQAELKKYMEKTEALKLMKRSSQQEVLQQTQDMLMRQTLSEDSRGGPHSSELHNRQESADSGLGMGSNFNLGSIPEDMSTGMEMDTDVGSVDPGRTPTNNTVGMDSDALIPSLSAGDLGDELSNDIMQDVQSILSTNKGEEDNLTWL